MRISVIIPYRPAHTSRIASLKVVEQHYKDVFPDAEIILADDPDPSAFNKGRAINVGVNYALGDILIFADCDSIIPAESLLEAVKIAPQFGMVVPFTRIRYLTKGCSVAWIAGDRSVVKVEEDFVKPSVGVCNVIHRDHFAMVHGFDPRFRGWGYEDAAFSMALECLLGPVKRLYGDAFHLWHPIDRDSKNPLQQAGLEHCKRYGANLGDLYGMRELVDEISRYCLPVGYKHRNDFYTETEGPNQDQLHKQVYRMAADFFKRHSCQSVVDIACGSAYKLRVNFKHAQSWRGMETASKVKILQHKFPQQRWEEATTQALLDITDDMVLCVNVLEKIQHPDQLLSLLHASSAKYFVFATPDRDILRGHSDLGPPRNAAHRREWTMSELKTFLSQWFQVIEHDLSDDADGIQVAICGRRQA